MLVRVRQQNELLKPVVEAGKHFRQKSSEWENRKALLEATPLYFHDAKTRLLEPMCAQWQQQILFFKEDIARLDQLLDRLRDRYRPYRNGD